MTMVEYVFEKKQVSVVPERHMNAGSGDFQGWVGII